VLEKLPGKTIILGVLDLSDMNVEMPETTAARIHLFLKPLRCRRKPAFSNLDSEDRE
jgi:methionine synthase II (cobalamin-independent)